MSVYVHDDMEYYSATQYANLVVGQRATDTYDTCLIKIECRIAVSQSIYDENTPQLLPPSAFDLDKASEC